MTKVGADDVATRRAGPADPELETRAINTIRTLAMDAVQEARSGHPGAPMGLAPLGYALFTRVLTYDPGHPDWADRDRFVLSCGHASMLLYALLHLTGYDVSLDDLKAFRQWGSPTAGHPERGRAPGVETTTGPLGQGFANAVGMAIAERWLAERFNRPDHAIVDHRTWVLASDGDLMEGVAQEAAGLAGHLGLGRLCVFYDDNRITIDGATDLTFSEDVGARFEAQGWHVLRLGDDATAADYAEAADAASAVADRPTLVICRTHIGFGSPAKQDSADAHGAPLGEDEVRRTKAALGWPEDARFLVPEDVEGHLRAAGRAAGDAGAWHRRFEAYRAAYPDDAPELERLLRGDLPEGWEASLPTFAAGDGQATRKASKAVLNGIKDAVPELVGGSADLSGSNGTVLDGEPVLARGAPTGRNVHYGVREHAMAAVMNGMALHGGPRPYGGTFLVFSDYMRPAVRLAALMRLPVVFVFTHDSIGVGEDGPTHQPVEHLAALRAVPDLTVIRPADGAETVEAWRLALTRPGPTALVLTRQRVPETDRTHRAAAARLAEGAYVLEGPSEPRTPDVVLLASGSEVAVSLDAAALLRGEGIVARVVSFPSWELFEMLEPARREAVLGKDVLRVVVEAGVQQGWHRWAGDDAAFVTVERFGASAPGPRVFEELGFTAQHVADTVRQALLRRCSS